MKVSAGKAVVKGHIADANTGDFDLVDGIAWPAGSSHTVVYVVSKPIASSAIAASPCPMTMARALTVVRNAGWIELTMDPAGKSDYFGSGMAFGGSGRESEVGGNYWSSTLKKSAGRASGSVEHKGKKAAFEFDLSVSSPKAAEVSESDRMAGAQAGAGTPAPTAEAMVAAYRAAHAAALKKDWDRPPRRDRLQSEDHRGDPQAPGNRRGPGGLRGPLPEARHPGRDRRSRGARVRRRRGRELEGREVPQLLLLDDLRGEARSPHDRREPAMNRGPVSSTA